MEEYAPKVEDCSEAYTSGYEDGYAAACRDILRIGDTRECNDKFK